MERAVLKFDISRKAIDAGVPSVVIPGRGQMTYAATDRKIKIVTINERLTARDSYRSRLGHATAITVPGVEKTRLLCNTQRFLPNVLNWKSKHCAKMRKECTAALLRMAGGAHAPTNSQITRGGINIVARVAGAAGAPSWGSAFAGPTEDTQMTSRPGTFRGGAFACWHSAVAKSAMAGGSAWPFCLEQAG